MRAAGECESALRAMAAAGIASWAAPLLEQLIFGVARPDFDAVLPAAVEVARAADALDGPAYRMVLVGPPPPDAVERLAGYIEFLESGGNPKRFPAAPPQRAAGAVLRQLGLDDAARRNVDVLRQAMTFLELTRSTRQVIELCGRLGVPSPKSTPAAVARRHRELERVDRAARAVEAMRREVLFIHPSSPIPVPDLDAVSVVTTAVLHAAAGLRHADDTAEAAAEAVADAVSDAVSAMPRQRTGPMDAPAASDGESRSAERGARS